MRTLANPVVGYVGVVLGVIAIASVAVFDLYGTAAKTQRHWDADIDRIIAQQQAKKQDMDTIAIAHAEFPDEESDAGLELAPLTTGSIQDEDEPAFMNDGAGAQKLRNQGGGKSSSRRGDERRQSYISSALATVPKFAAAAAATTTTLLRLR